jgi:hypothetical protein
VLVIPDAACGELADRAVDRRRSHQSSAPGRRRMVPSLRR